MKILWAKIGFLHPATRGGDIRTLEMLKHLRARHEIHYATPNDLTHPEGLARCHEYCSKAHTVPFRPVAKPSPAFFAELVRGFFDPLPVGIFRWQIAPFGRLLAELLAREHFDRVVCDFLFPAINFPSLKGCVLFQHNVEAIIWQRLAANASNPLKRAYLSRQAERMFDYERRVCGEVDRVIAVSEVDARLMREMYGIRRVDAIPTGVDINYFAPPEIRTDRKWDLIFVGSMDYLPNIEGVRYFVRDVLPRIRAARPGTTLAVAGRKPPEEITAMARDPGITVTGTVADIRPYLWGSAVSVVPLLTGGGTRLKIYESMAACRPVVSTTVGAEGLTVHPPHDIRIADTPDRFAAECLAMLENGDERERVACAGRRLVAENFSWDQVSRRFEALLQ